MLKPLPQILKETFGVSEEDLKEAQKIRTEKGSEILSAEKAFSAVGVTPNTENLNLKEAGVNISNGFIKVDDSYKTDADGIYAVGDVAGIPLLAHAASHEGIYTVEKIVGLSPEKPDITHIPSCVYCQPQVASIGFTEAEANKKGFNIEKGSFPFKANGKSVAAGDTAGMVKLIFNSDSKELLGGHIIGHDATELIAEIGIAQKFKAKPEDFINVVHSHPTASEAIMEAAADSFGRAIHI